MNERQHSSLLLVAVMVTLVALLPGQAAAATHYVAPAATGADTGCATAGYTTIGSAIAAASAGDTIMVCRGSYAEQVVIDKTLTLLGAQADIDARTRPFVPANESIIDHPCGPVQIMADNVVLNGFTVQGSTYPGPCFLSGIWSNPRYSATQGGHQILNNIIQDNVSGIELDSTCTNTTLVKRNLIRNNNNPGHGSGNAIQTSFGLCNATIDSNRLSGQSNISLFGYSGGSQGIVVSNNDLVDGSSEPIAGEFVIGDFPKPAVGDTVNFWGAQWAKNNQLTGGSAPNAFKGFADQVVMPPCGGTWITRPGNSSDPPPTVPTEMAVIVSSSVQKNGPVISGDVKMIVMVRTNPDYGPAPGHRGTGQVIRIICPAAIPPPPPD